MSELDQNSQKTVVAFVAGLLVGGLLVWVFTAGPSDDQTSSMNSDESTVNTDVNTSNNTGGDTNADTTTTDENTSSTDTNTNTSADMNVGEGALEVSDQPAGKSVTIDSATFPNDEGWIGIRDYENGNLGRILGVARFSKEQGLIPTEVELLRATESGKTYAAVFFTESGDREFSLADDVQIDSVVTPFTAQ